ncbi:hypothetical protein LEMLEM_LOCUS15758 [Lemmus lemmus]
MGFPYSSWIVIQSETQRKQHTWNTECLGSIPRPFFLQMLAPATSRGRWALERFLMELVSHLGKKLLLHGVLHKLDTKNHQREDC